MGETLHTRFTDLSRFGIPPAVAGEPTKEQRRRLGDFSIYIFDKPENVEGLPHVEPDAYGFRWSYEIPERGGDDGQWAATKVYGNVRLTWFAATRGHDERLITLDGALSGLG